MVNLTIDRLPVSVKEGTTLMEAAESIGIHIPHLCYWKGLNEILDIDRTGHANGV